MGEAKLFARHRTSLYGHRNVCLACFRIRRREEARTRRGRIGFDGRQALNTSTSARYSRLKYQAAQRDIACELTRAEWESVVSQPCHYCNGPLPRSGYGLDRKDNDGPYVPANVVPCCHSCNSRKKNRPYVPVAKP